MKSMVSIFHSTKYGAVVNLGLEKAWYYNNQGEKYIVVPLTNYHSVDNAARDYVDRSGNQLRRINGTYWLSRFEWVREWMVAMDVFLVSDLRKWTIYWEKGERQ